MENETTTNSLPDEVMSEVWKIKEENAAAHGYDVDAIAAAARKNQQQHPDRVVSRRGADARQTDAPNP